MNKHAMNIMNCSTKLLSKFQTDNLEAKIWIISTIEWQQHSSVYVQEIIQSEGKLKAKELLRLLTSTKGVVSVKTSCAHSVTLKRINKTPHLFMHFHIVIWIRELLWKYPSCLSKLLSQELWPKQLRKRHIIIEQFITNNKECKEILVMCEECKQQYLSYIPTSVES